MSDSTKQLLQWISFGLQMFGALVATVCYLPGAVKIVKTNDTRSISTTMSVLTTGSCFLWVLIGILNIIAFFDPNKPATIAAGIGTIVSNTGLVSCSLIIFVYKLRNTHYAKKLNMTEEEYYQSCGHYKHLKMVYLHILHRQEANKENKIETTKNAG